MCTFEAPCAGLVAAWAADEAYEAACDSAASEAYEEAGYGRPSGDDYADTGRCSS